MNIEDLKNDGFSINKGDLLELILLNSITNKIFLAQVLKQQLELKELIIKDNIDNDEVINELSDLLDILSIAATNEKN